MAKLSVVIVNYNVKYFIEQALLSVQKAIINIDAEVFVVDNNSTDGSVDLIKRRFPWVKLIVNTKNTGFSVANNQAINASAGEYVLLLNPDTVVEEDTLEKCLAFMDSHPDAGALGVKMLDGKGRFLPESKRSLPTPAVSFFKIFGLSRLFPRSKAFGRYHLGYLPEDEVHEVDVLPGAFMMMRREALDKVGMLDEDFFMYGEDIDLSYRIQQGGYKVYYFPETRIIHYKGESTKKGSLNYVRIFYQAMVIFAQKHFTGSQALVYRIIINLAIYLRAVLASLSRLVRNLALPVLDMATLFVGMYLIKEFWTLEVKSSADYYPAVYMTLVVPAYVFLWCISIYFSGGYDRPLRTSRTVRGVFLGTLVIATIYAFLPENWRYSRGMILAGAAWAAITLMIVRYVYGVLRGRHISLSDTNQTRIVIVGSSAEARRALSLISQAGVESRYIGFISPFDEDNHNEYYLGKNDQLKRLVGIYQISEVIFCGKDVDNKVIIDDILSVGPTLNYKILPEGSDSIIGSNSKDSAGDLYAIDVNLAISSSMNERNKRLFDLLVCVLTLVTYPIFVFFLRNPWQFVKNWFAVFFANKTWVGYHPAEETKQHFWLPPIKTGVLSPAFALKDRFVDDQTLSRLNILYAKDYTLYKDIGIVLKNLKNLGNEL